MNKCDHYCYLKLIKFKGNSIGCRFNQQVLEDEKKHVWCHIDRYENQELFNLANNRDINNKDYLEEKEKIIRKLNFNLNQNLYDEDFIVSKLKERYNYLMKTCDHYCYLDLIKFCDKSISCRFNQQVLEEDKKKVWCHIDRYETPELFRLANNPNISREKYREEKERIICKFNFYLNQHLDNGDDFIVGKLEERYSDLIDV